MTVFRFAVPMMVVDISLVLTMLMLPISCYGDTDIGSEVETPGKPGTHTPAKPEVETSRKPGMDGPALTTLIPFSGEEFRRLSKSGILLTDGSGLFGTLSNGGPKGLGLVFFVGTDGSGYRVLHTFSSEGVTGQMPVGLSLLADGMLYGVTERGGAGRRGVVFSMDKYGKKLSVLHSFAGGEKDGYGPTGTLAASGTTLYGMAHHGGGLGNGIVFSMKTDGSGFSILHSFPADNGFACDLSGSLVLDERKLYGVTRFCGDYGGGIVFSIGIDGEDYSVLHSFSGGLNDGWKPTGSDVVIGDTLFGIAEQGGTWNLGIVFSMKTDGSGFSIIHSFDGCSGILRRGAQNLQLCGSRLCGVTDFGGIHDSGVVFSLEKDGNDFRIIHDFSRKIEGRPQGILFDRGFLYGFAFSCSTPVPGRIYRLGEVQ